MAEGRESTILDVKLDAGKVAQDLQDLITRIAALKAQQKELNEQIKAGNDIDGKYAEQLIRVKDQLSWTEKQAKGLSATTKLLNADTLTYSDSLNGERQKLADMQKAYDQLDRAARESEGGKIFLEQIQKQSEAVKQLEAETGRAQRNVGNYPKVLQPVIGVFQQLKGLGGNVVSMLGGATKAAAGAGGAFAGLAGSVKVAMIALAKFLATPAGLILAAIAAALALVVKSFQKLSEAFKKNDEAGTAWAKLMATFQPIVDGIGRAFDKLATAIGNTVGKLAAWIGSKSKAVKAAQDLIQATDDLQEAERKYTEESAKRNMEVSELRAKAAEKDKYTAQERQKFLKDAIELEKQNLEDEKAIKAEQLRILEETAKKNSDTSDATKDKIAQARAAMYQAEQAYYDGTRRLQKEYANATKEIEAERKAAEAERQKELEKQLKEAEDNAQKLADLREQMRLREMSELERQIDALQKARDAELAIDGLTIEERVKIQTYYLDEIAKKQAEFGDKLVEENKKLNEQIGLRDLEAEEEEEIPSLEEMVRNMFGLDAEAVEYFKELLDQGVSYSDAKTRAIADQQQRMALAYAESFGAMGDAMAGLGNAIGDLAGKNKAAVAASKAMTLVSILMNQAKAISEGAVATAKGIASAASLPFPANIPAIISTVATITGMMTSVLTSIAQAKKLFSQANSQKFARGGIVEGNAYAGDNITVQADAGEMYLNRQTQHELFNFLTGKENSIQAGYNLESMTAAMTAAVAAMPAPVMVYEEFKTFEGNVASFNEIAKIG